MAKRNGLTNHRYGGQFNGSEYPVGYDRWVFGQFIPAGPTALNLASRRIAPRGDVPPLPEVLRPSNLPKRPPARAA